MIQLTETIWIGNSEDEMSVDVDDFGIGGILNVAQDLHGTRGWGNGVEYMQVGLIDGPGNTIRLYCAVVLGLAALIERCKRVLVCCHDGGRSLAAALMYLNLVGGQWRPDPTGWSHWPTWEERLGVICDTVSVDLPTVHKAHIEAFSKIPWGLLEVI